MYWQVEYELVGYENAPDYFAVDKNSGIITVKTDLQPEQTSDFEVWLRYFIVIM